MELALQFQLRITFQNQSKMAIPFFVDPEYGPLPPPAAQPAPPPRSPQPPPWHGGNNRPLVTIDDNNNHVIPDLVHGVATFPHLYSRQQPMRNTSQVSNSENSRESVSSWPSWLPLDTLANCLFNNPLSTFTFSRTEQNESPREDGLPDVVQCHSGFSFDLSFQSTRVYASRPPTSSTSPDEQQHTSRRRRRHPAGAVQPQDGRHPVPLNQELIYNADDMDEWNLELKVAVNSWKAVGADLRDVGDQYAFEFESSLQRQRSPRQESFKVQCGFKMAMLPALALVGVATGLAYLRRRL